MQCSGCRQFIDDNEPSINIQISTDGEVRRELQYCKQCADDTYYIKDILGWPGDQE